MKLNGNSVQVFEKIAKLQLEEIPIEQVAAIVGGTVEEIDKILELVEYREVQAKLFSDVFEGNDTRNRGWDEIESTALGKLLTHMDNGFHDPELLLKVAAVANKAHRKHVGNKPISAGDGPLPTTLHFNATYIDKLVNYGPGDRPAREIAGEKNTQSFLTVDKVEEILSFKPGYEFISQEK